MNNDKRQSPNQGWCPPDTENPAPQPKAPGSCECHSLHSKDPPALNKPDDCPPSSCDCKCPPDKKTPRPSCLERASDRQAAIIAAGDKAKAFKTDLDAFQAKTKAASLEYTRDKYDKLVKQWEQQDRDIADLVRRLVCAVPCWECIIECYVCPLIDDLHNVEKWLCGTDALYETVDNLYDLQYWRARDRAIKESRFNRIKAVLAAWEKPAQTIQTILTNDQALIDAANKAMGTTPGPVIYDVFMRLVPMHLAVAPPQSRVQTKIDQRYTKFCGCDQGTADDCCGPDVGVLSFRERLIGPQPYLIDPDSYFKLICCLVEKRYEPAKDALTQAEIEATTLDNMIVTLKAQIVTGLSSMDQTAKASIPSVVDCCDYQQDDGPGTPAATR